MLIRTPRETGGCASMVDARRSCWIVLLAAILSSLSPLSTEVFAPAMPGAAHDMGRVTVTNSLSIYFVSVACVHALHGVAIVKCGQRTVGLAGVALFSAACLSVALVVETPFLGARVVQAIGASACTVVAFDLVRTHLVPRVHMARVNALRAVLLVVAPMAAEAVVVLRGWRLCFGVLAGLAGLSVPLLVCAVQARSRVARAAPVRRPDPNDAVAFALWTAADAISFSSMFVWISHAPFLVSVESFGVWYGLTFTGSVVGSALSRYTPAVSGFAGASTVVAVLALVARRCDARQIFGLMTLSNAARAVAGCHAMAEALARGPTMSSAVFHVVRMLAVAATVQLTSRAGDAWIVMASLSALCALVSLCVRERTSSGEDLSPL